MLAGVRPVVERLFDLTRVRELLTSSPTRAEALEQRVTRRGAG